MTEPGTRVGAVLKADEEVVDLLGYGVYVGDEVPPESADAFFYLINAKTPKIKLDNGAIVWGCQCYWGAEEKVTDWIGDRRIVDAQIGGVADA